MSVIIGSARIDERSRARGGSSGDQKQSSKPDYRGEVSMQEFYVSPKGWYIFRAKKDEHANGLATSMKRACNNPNIGYDQYQRDGVVKNGTDTKTKTEADCSSLVRRCIIEATGKDPGNIRTATMPSVLPKTGLFEPKISYTSGTTLYTGDILVTKTTGHTVIVVDGHSRGGSSSSSSGSNSSVASPTLKQGNKGSEVTKLQKNLNTLKYLGKDGKKLTVDGDFGPNTNHALRAFQKDKKLEVDGIYGPKSYDAMKKALK